MTDNKTALPLPSEAADRLIAAHDGDVALLYLYIARTGALDAERAAGALCRTAHEIDAAAEKLRRMGLLDSLPAPLSPQLVPEDTLPEYRAEDLILVHSHNDYAHMVMKYFGTEPECVELFKQFSPLPEDYYAENFTEWRYFTARYLTDVLKTLYAEPDRFPHIMECLLRANRGEYFDAVWSGQYDVAQKYGSLTTDYTDVNHTIGIIYTPHPFILVVMTDHVGGPWTVIRDMARMFGDYTLSLEDALAEKQAAEEAERLRQEEEAARLAEEERVRREAEANRPPEEEQTGTITLSPDPDATPRPAQTDPPQNAGNNIRLWVILGAAVLLLALIPIAIRSRRRNRVGV